MVLGAGRIRGARCRRRRGGVGAVQARRPVTASRRHLVGRDDRVRLGHLPAEVRRVQAAAEDRLVDAAELGEREAVAEERLGDPRVADLVPQAPQRVVDDAVVVEGESWQVLGEEPADVPVVGHTGRLVAADERPVDDRDHPVRRSVDVAEGVQLLEVPGLHAGGLEQPGGRGLLEALVDADPSTGQRPGPLERLGHAADQGHRQREFARLRVPSERHDDRRHGDADAVVRCGHHDPGPSGSGRSDPN